jgi:hypothetical protein
MQSNAPPTATSLQERLTVGSIVGTYQTGKLAQHLMPITIIAVDESMEPLGYQQTKALAKRL